MHGTNRTMCTPKTKLQLMTSSHQLFVAERNTATSTQSAESAYYCEPTESEDTDIVIAVVVFVDVIVIAVVVISMFIANISLAL